MVTCDWRVPTPVAMVTVAVDVTMVTTFLLISNLLSAIVLLTVCIWCSLENFVCCYDYGYQTTPTKMQE